MAKKHGKNLQKLLKKKQLQELQSRSAPAELPAATLPAQSALPEAPKLPALSAGDNKPVMRTLISITAVAVILVAVTLSSRSTNYLGRFGDWLYLSLQLG